ncbi:MAG: ABC transporter ATP-binding protein [Bradyrhizobium sp.]|uniref:oligopeptide/dipeptide ABC transporter ATP-binding protein n=1 Tax=Bradyrhizobium sp. TaxID=376 RepID=UPI001D8D7D7C|nr:oligopeptide/dipeptide ABC transporter ATP-binding protein [Bradyrhizobium sp.]MBV9564853.1 ABC transporter ATP-binding protein [Bradyrhizobium sp.]
MSSESSVASLNARPLMRVENLTLEFPSRSRGASIVRAIDDVSIDIAEGEIIGLVGESGSGKTTLGKTLLGMYSASAGHIWYEGIDLATADARSLKPHRRDLQMVFQDPLSSFNPRFRIGDSMAVPLRLHHICRGKALEAEVGRLLERVGLSADHARRFPHELSGGQLQRVAIARVLGIGPKLIVADEAVSKLDVSIRAQILNLLKAINRDIGVSLVFITHDLSVARFLCNRIAVMYFGRIVELGSTESIFSDAMHPYTRRLLEARRANQPHDPADDVTGPVTASGSVDRFAGCNYRDRCSVRISRCDRERPGLEGPSNERRFACFNPRGHQEDPAPALAMAR